MIDYEKIKLNNKKIINELKCFNLGLKEKILQKHNCELCDEILMDLGFKFNIFSMSYELDKLDYRGYLDSYGFIQWEKKTRPCNTVNFPIEEILEILSEDKRDIILFNINLFNGEK